MTCCLDLGEVDLARIDQAGIVCKLAEVVLSACDDAERLDDDHARHRRWEHCDQ
jgi:hypothetical protein